VGSLQGRPVRLRFEYRNAAFVIHSIRLAQAVSETPDQIRKVLPVARCSVSKLPRVLNCALGIVFWLGEQRCCA